MLPCPVTGVVISFSDLAVRCYLRIYQSDIAVIGLRLFVDEIEDPLCACACHYDSVHLHRQLVKVAHELLAHVEERDHDGDPERKSRDREVGRVREDHDAACCRQENIYDVADVVDYRSQDVRIGISLATV